MSKRKRETADEALASLERHRETKKQRTNSITSKAAPKQQGTEGSAQLKARKREEKRARKLAKRERRDQASQQRKESGRQDGIKTGEHGGDTRMVEVQEKRLLKKGRIKSSKSRQGNQELGKAAGQKLREKHKSKKEKRKEKSAQSSGFKDKKEAVEATMWKISDPLGGQMLDVDPVFSPDEK